MAGDFDPDKVIATIDQYFGTWKPSTNLSRPEFPDCTINSSRYERCGTGNPRMYRWMEIQWRGSVASRHAECISEILANGKAGLMDLIWIRKWNIWWWRFLQFHGRLQRVYSRRPAKRRTDTGRCEDASKWRNWQVEERWFRGRLNSICGEQYESQLLSFTENNRSLQIILLMLSSTGKNGKT